MKHSLVGLLFAIWMVAIAVGEPSTLQGSPEQLDGFLLMSQPSQRELADLHAAMGEIVISTTDTDMHDQGIDSEVEGVDADFSMEGIDTMTSEAEGLAESMLDFEGISDSELESQLEGIVDEFDLVAFQSADLGDSEVDIDGTMHADANTEAKTNSDSMMDANIEAFEGKDSDAEKETVEVKAKLAAKVTFTQPASKAMKVKGPFTLRKKLATIRKIMRFLRRSLVHRLRVLQQHRFRRLRRLEMKLRVLANLARLRLMNQFARRFNQFLTSPDAKLSVKRLAKRLIRAELRARLAHRLLVEGIENQLMAAYLLAPRHHQKEESTEESTEESKESKIHSSRDARMRAAIRQYFAQRLMTPSQQRIGSRHHTQRLVGRFGRFQKPLSTQPITQRMSDAIRMQRLAALRMDTSPSYSLRGMMDDAAYSYGTEAVDSNGDYALAGMLEPIVATPAVEYTNFVQQPIIATPTPAVEYTNLVQQPTN